MLVLIFQCIVDGILDFDYAPSRYSAHDEAQKSFVT